MSSNIPSNVRCVLANHASHSHGWQLSVHLRTGARNSPTRRWLDGCEGDPFLIHCHNHTHDTPVCRPYRRNQRSVFTRLQPHDDRLWNKKDGYRQLKVRQLGSLRPWEHRDKCYMDRKRIQCLSNASKHIHTYLQPFTSYSEILVGNRNFFLPLCI